MNKVLKVYNPDWAKDNWYDKYDAFVVIIKDGELDETVELIRTKGYDGNMPEGWENDPKTWKITYIGLTEEPVQIVLSSFNAA